MTMRNYPHSQPINATIRQVEPFTVDLAARGGGGLNAEYAKGLAAIMTILFRKKAKLMLVEVVSRPMMSRPQAERVVPVEYGWPMNFHDYPGASLKSVVIRKAIMRGIARVGRKPGERGGDSSRKIRLHYTVRDSFGRSGRVEGKDINWAEHIVEDKHAADSGDDNG